MSRSLYDKIADSYSEHRQPDERIATRINAALGKCQSLLNVGAGTGSYEPSNRHVVAIEPSIEMIKRRRNVKSQPIQGSAGQLPFRDGTFDAAVAILTIHHWPDPDAGLAEMCRVARKQVVILTWDPEHSGFWLVRDYFPEILAIDRPIFPSLGRIEKALGVTDVQIVPIPADCTDGFLGAYWRRPEAYLDQSVRSAISTFSRLDPESGLAQLRQDLDNGIWHDRNRELQTLSELDIGYRLVIAGCA
jgi:SAM-dependent methyltransferase